MIRRLGNHYEGRFLQSHLSKWLHCTCFHGNVKKVSTTKVVAVLVTDCTLAASGQLVVPSG